MSDAPPNWAQDDPSQPDYIANRDKAELQILVNGEEFTQTDEGVVEPLQLKAGSNIQLEKTVEKLGGVDVNTITINATGGGESAGVSGIQVDDLELTGKVSFRAGSGAYIYAEKLENGESIISIATGVIDPEESTYVAGDGIELVKKEDKYAISIAGNIQADKIATVYASSLINDTEQILILNGGKSNGYY